MILDLFCSVYFTHHRIVHLPVISLPASQRYPKYRTSTLLLVLENTDNIDKSYRILNYVCMYRTQNVFLRCPTPRLHCFLSSHWPSFRFFSFMAFIIPSIQFFFGHSSCSLLPWHPHQ